MLELKDNLVEVWMINNQLYEELKRIIPCFKEHNIETMLLKGIDLVSRVYLDIDLRPMADIDLLIRKQDLPKIEQALSPLNYLIYPGYRELQDKPTSLYLNAVVCKKLIPPFFSLHLHWHILNYTFYPGYGYISNLNIDKIWQEAEPVQIGDVEVLRMVPEHLLLYLSEHHLKHAFDRTILLNDIDVLLKHYEGKLDWEKVINDALEFNLTRPLYFSLFLVSQILGTKVPESVFSKIKPKCISIFERKFIDSVLKGRHSPNFSFFVFLAMNRGIKGKLRFIFRTVFPDPRFVFQLKEIEDIKSNFLFYLRHLMRILGILLV